MINQLRCKCSRMAWAGISLAVGGAHAYAGATVVTGEAPHGPTQPSNWASGVKQAFGTAYEDYDADNLYSGASPTAPLSKVWFTAAQGILSEVYWPTIDQPQVRDSQILVTDGSTFLFQERTDADSRVEWLHNGVPVFRITNRDPQHRFEIQRTLYTDPDRDVVLTHIHLTRWVPDLKFYALHNPAVGNTPLGNSGRVSLGEAPGAGLFAWQGDQAQALVFSVPLLNASAGFSGLNDGFVNLSDHFDLGQTYRLANQGDVVLTGQLDLPSGPGVSDFDEALGFAGTTDEAYAIAEMSLSTGPAVVQTKYVAQWQAYQATLQDLSGASSDSGALYRASVATLKSMEDKTYAGAFVASPAIPWGLLLKDWNIKLEPGESRGNLTVGYHLVWPRDLYQMATAFLAIGDRRSSLASLNYLRSVQLSVGDGDWRYGPRVHSKDGSFPQNTWVNGETGWGGLQMDEVAMPILLAYRLWKNGVIQASAYWDMIHRAGDFVQSYGPWSPMERWEEQYGASPSTVAAEVAGLWCAAEFAGAMGDTERAGRYRATADAWSAKPGDNLDTWMFTNTGRYGNGQYFVRLVGAGSFLETWNPNAEFRFNLANQAGSAREKDVTDGGFLELVRLGVRSALDAHVRETLPEYDQTIRVDLPNIGPAFFRYLGDHYNSDESTGAATPGMLWPFLTGERGHYEIARAIAMRESGAAIDATADIYIQAMEKMATPSHELPEQVWDTGARAGQPTGAATPLGWTHGEYIKLLRTKTDRAVYDNVRPPAAP